MISVVFIVGIIPNSQMAAHFRLMNHDIVQANLVDDLISWYVPSKNIRSLLDDPR